LRHLRRRGPRRVGQRDVVGDQLRFEGQLEVEGATEYEVASRFDLDAIPTRSDERLRIDRGDGDGHREQHEPGEPARDAEDPEYRPAHPVILVRLAGVPSVATATGLQRNDALTPASAAPPGTRSTSPSVVSGASTVY